jgi:HK97 family phage prohead protease
MQKKHLEQKNLSFPLDVESINEGGSFTGYASIFGKVDNHNDIILNGAFKRTLRETDNGRDVKLLWQHDPAEPIGYFTHIKEDAYGLYVEGKLLLDVQRAREAYSLLKNNAIGGLSIGFTVQNHSYDVNSTRLLKDIDLFEISLVTFPANNDAGIISLKAEDNYLKLDKAFDRAIAALRSNY